MYGLKQLIIIILSKWENRSIWPIDGARTGTTNLGQSGPNSNGHKRVLHVSQSSGTGASLLDAVWVPYTGPSFWRDILHPCRGAVSVFYGPNWQDWCKIKQIFFQTQVNCNTSALILELPLHVSSSRFKGEH